MSEPPRKRQKTKMGSEFVDAEASDEDEMLNEDLVEYTTTREELNERESAREMEQMMKQQAQKRLQRGNVLQNLNRFLDEEEDEHEEEIFHDTGIEEEGDETVMVDKSNLVPTTSDPKLFMVRCKFGKEREVCVTLMKKFFDYRFDRSKANLQFTSAIALDNFQGYVYIEAMRAAHVRAAIDGMEMVFPSTVRLVPLDEMIQVLETPSSNRTKLKSGQWVRVNRGLYKNDLAQVESVDEARGTAEIKLIPRLEVFRPKGESKKRPPQKLFNAEELKSLGAFVQMKRDIRAGEMAYLYQGQKFLNNYLIKSINIKSLQVKDVNPDLSEIQQFHGTNSGPLPKSHRKCDFREGDEVRCFKGDLKGLTGTVMRVNKKDETVLVQPDQEEMQGKTITLDINNLTYNLKISSLVRVTAGKHKGETGSVVQLKDETVIIYNDVKHDEMEVFISDIQQVTQATTNEVIGKYSYDDLVKIDAMTVGVIIQATKSVLKILDNNGTVRNIKYQELKNKVQRSGFRIPDKRGNMVGKNDTVKILSGQYANREATVKHVYRIFLFCNARDIIENGGNFVIRAKQCQLKGNQAPSRSTFGNRPAQTRPSFTGYKRARPSSWMNQRVRLRGGPYKGYVGVVKGGTEESARVQLQSKFKTITIPTSMLTKEATRVPNSGYSRGAGFNDISGANTPHYLPHTPGGYFKGAQTPLVSGQTPAPSPMGEPRTPYQNGPPSPAGSRSDAPPSPSNFSVSEVSQSDVQSTSNFGGPQSTSSYSNAYGGSSFTPGNSSGYSSTTPGNRYQGNYQSSYQTPSVSTTSYQTPGFQSNYQTPGNNYTNQTSSYQTPSTSGYTPSQSASYQTPGNSSAFTPGNNTSYQQQGYTPGNSYGRNNPVTPGNMSKQTPNPGYNNPITPGAYSHQPYGAFQQQHQQPEPQPEKVQGNWVQEGCVINIRSGSHAGKSGQVIQMQKGSQCMVSLDNGENVMVDTHELEPKRPKQGDIVLALSGETQGQTGAVFGVEEKDCVVKLDGTGQISMVDISQLCVFNRQ